MDQLAHRLMVAVEIELYSVLAELRSIVMVVIENETATPKMYEAAIISVEIAREQMALAADALSVAAPEGPR